MGHNFEQKSSGVSVNVIAIPDEKLAFTPSKGDHLVKQEWSLEAVDLSAFPEQTVDGVTAHYMDSGSVQLAESLTEDMLVGFYMKVDEVGGFPPRRFGLRVTYGSPLWSTIVMPTYRAVPMPDMGEDWYLYIYRIEGSDQIQRVSLGAYSLSGTWDWIGEGDPPSPVCKVWVKDLQISTTLISETDHIWNGKEWVETITGVSKMYFDNTIGDIVGFDGVITSEAEFDTATEAGVYKVNLYTSSESANESVNNINIYEDGTLLVKTYDELILSAGNTDYSFCEQTRIVGATILTRVGNKYNYDAEPTWSWTAWSEPYASAADLSNYVKSTDYATNTTAGVVKVPISGNGQGIILNSNNSLQISKAERSDIAAKSAYNKPITCVDIEYVVEVCTNQDSTAELTEQQLKLPPSTQFLNDVVGDIDATLDGIIAIQESLIGGESA